MQVVVILQKFFLKKVIDLEDCFLLELNFEVCAQTSLVLATSLNALNPLPKGVIGPPHGQGDEFEFVQGSNHKMVILCFAIRSTTWLEPNNYLVPVPCIFIVDDHRLLIGQQLALLAEEHLDVELGSILGEDVRARIRALILPPVSHEKTKPSSNLLHRQLELLLDTGEAPILVC
jgi:hypothetical protein